MNQDHLQQQPAADEYVTGGPSEFAEDVHPSAGTWKAEYSGGEVSRNEIGMPEMRRDTFNHPEKTAAMDDETILKKANLCTKIATKMLGKTASDQMVEDQALALMEMPDASLIETANRLAKKMADDDEEDEGQNQGQKQAQEQGKESDDDEETKQGQGQQQGKQGGQVPPQFKEQIEKKKEEAKGKGKDEGKDEGKNKEARLNPGNAFIAAMKAGDGDGVQQALSQMLSQAMQQMGQQQQGAVYGQGNQQQMAQQEQQAQQQAQMAQQEQQAQQQAQMAQQQAQQMAQQQEQARALAQQQQMGQQQQAPMGQQQQMSDDQLLDQMLQDDLGQPQVMGTGMPMGQQQQMGLAIATAEPEIQLEPNTMDVGEIQLGAGDEVLTSLFASNPEYQNAAEAHALQNGGVRPAVTAAQPMTRTAATRTVGTRPTAGVAQIGGGVVGATSGGTEVDKLAGLWQSAPDVSNVFR